MTTTISKIQIQVVKRFIEVNIDFNKKYTKSDVDDIFCKFNEFQIQFDWKSPDDETDDETDDGLIEVCLYLQGNEIFSAAISKTDESVKVDKVLLKKCYEKLDKMVGKKFVKCKIMSCTNFIFKNDLCKNDYVYDCKNPNDCCICLDNDGAWTKLDCEHILHRSCLLKFNLRQHECPLCRKEINLSKAQFNYLFDC